MTEVTESRQTFLRMLAQRGTSIVAARKCVIVDADPVTYDADHPVLMAEPIITTPAPRATPDTRWREAIDKAQQDITPEEWRAYVDRLANGMAGPCDCTRHWRAWLARWPAIGTDPVSRLGFLWLSKQVIATRIKRPVLDWPAWCNRYNVNL